MLNFNRLSLILCKAKELYPIRIMNISQVAFGEELLDEFVDAVPVAAGFFVAKECVCVRPKKGSGNLLMRFSCPVGNDCHDMTADTGDAVLNCFIIQLKHRTPQGDSASQLLALFRRIPGHVAFVSTVA